MGINKAKFDLTLPITWLFIMGLMVFFLLSGNSVQAEQPLDLEEPQDPGLEEPYPGEVPLEDDRMDLIRGEVLSVESHDVEDGLADYFEDLQVAEIKLLSGPQEGEVYELENMLSGHPYYDIELTEGLEILMMAEYDGDEMIELHVHEIVRETHIYYLLAIFLIAMLVIGGLTGFKTILTLVFTGFMVIQVLLPLILRGYNPLWLSVAVSALVAIVTLAVIGGLGQKTVVAALGTVGGLVVAGLLALFAGHGALLTGLSSEEAQMLFYAEAGGLDLQGLLFAGIIIGALGAVMDIGMSIASACHEIVEINPRVDRESLFKAGMNVGRDIMGTMANTLILAYTGSAMPLLLLLLLYEVPYVEVINMDLMATEVIRALTGSIGLIVVIPLTSLASSLVFAKEKRKRRRVS